jgi:hypothetical protein
VARWLCSAGDRSTEDLSHLPAEARAQIEADMAERDPEPEIYPENHEAVKVFGACQTQWRVSFAGAVGLDYAALEAVMRIRQVEDQADCLWRVQIMEAEVLTALAERR